MARACAAICGTFATATRAKLRASTYRVAGVIGRWLTKLHDVRDDWMLERAIALDQGNTVIAFADDHVVLVDERDNPIGTAPKQAVHRDGRLHRAVSVMLFDDDGRLLLQRRADGKYHSGGLWSNTCCGHPRPGEPVLAAGRRRLRAEMGIDVGELTQAGHFIYRCQLPRGLVEHELDHVLVGRWAGDPRPNIDEVSAWQWMYPRSLERSIAATRARYTVWLEQVLAYTVSTLGVSADK